MKKIIILALAIVFSLYACTDDEQNNNKNISPLVSINGDSIKSLLIGKWQKTLSGGGSRESIDHTKDSLFLYFTDNSYYEFYKKDSLTHRDIFQIKYDKSHSYNDSNWYIVYNGMPSLIEDSSSSTGYRTINESTAEIINLNDSILDLNYDPFSSTHKKIK